MKPKFIPICLMLSLLLGSLGLAQAQARPSIVYFDSTLKSITLTEAEQGTATTTFSWIVLGMTPNHHLSLEVLQAAEWTPIELAPPPLARYAVAVTVAHSQSFAPPTYRLVLWEGTTLLDQWVLTIPYTPPDAHPAPVVTFTSDDNVVMQDGNGGGLINAAWLVTDRLPTHQLRFTQYLAAGDALEFSPLPLGVQWVMSAWRLPLTVVVEPSAAQIHVRLDVIDVLTETVIGSADMLVPLTLVGSGGLGGDRGGGGGGVIQGNEPPAFVTANISQNSARYGETITIRWQHRGTVQRFTATVKLGEAAPLTIVDSREAAGSFAYVLPTGSYTQAEFTLTVIDGQGLSRSRVEVVRITQ